jgi:hypothetical protein
MGLFDSILPSLFSAGNQVKKNVRGLLADPVGQSNNLARSVSDNLQGLLGPLAGIQAETARGQGVLGSDPALQQAARDRQVAAVSNFLAPMATVWHGSPHKFGKFDSSKIGTGEGAQAYGHGLYLAENPSVATGYADKLSQVSSDGGFTKVPRVATYGARRVDMNAPSSSLTPGELALTYANLEGGRANGLLALREMAADPYITDRERYKRAADIMTRLDPKKIGSESGNLYKVDLPDSAIAKMLDWDKPPSQQPQEVMGVIRQKLKEQKYLGPNDNGPRQLQAALKAWKMEHGGMSESAMESLVGGRGNLLGATPEEVAQNLKGVGIPGIRYLDGGSRGAGTGTRNYVVFPGNEGLLTILERNGKPLLGD